MVYAILLQFYFLRNFSSFKCFCATYTKRESEKKNTRRRQPNFFNEKSAQTAWAKWRGSKAKKHEIRQQNIQLYMLVEYLIYLWIFINEYMCNIWGRMHKMFCWNASICVYNKRSFCLIYFIKIVINAPNLRKSNLFH